MGNLNQVALEGFLARDATETARGGLLFTIATNKTRKNKETDEWEDTPSFINSSIGFPTDHQKRSLVQGAHVFATGELRSYNRERDGRKETVMIFEVRQITIVPRAERREQGVQTPPPRPQQAPQPTQNRVQAAAQQFGQNVRQQRPQAQAHPQRPAPQIQQDDFSSEFAEFEGGYNWNS